MKTNYEELTAAFEDLAINPANFKHVDHVGVAYVMLNKYSFLNAITKYSENINAIATRAEAAKKFNTTISIAFLSIISERMQTTEHSDVQDFISRNQDLVTSNPLKQFYSAERLQSEEARLTFLLPDLTA